MTCPHTLGRLVCDRTTDHDPEAVGGHTYSASALPDRHDASEQRAEETRG